MNTTSKAMNSFISGTLTRSLIGYRLYPIIFLFFIVNYSCNEESGIYSNKDTDSTNLAKISTRTPSLYTVYVSTDEEYGVSYPNSYTTVLTFEGNYQWSDNAETEVTWHDATDMRITVWCTCTGLSGSCSGRVTGSGDNEEYSCNQDGGCTGCELHVKVECEAQNDINIPNGVSVRETP